MTVHLINILDSHFDPIVISLSAVTSDGFRSPRQVHSPAFSRFLRGSNPSYKYDNTRGASSSHEITPRVPPALPSLPLALRVSVAYRKEVILIDRHVLLVVFFRRFTILEIRKRELKFHHRYGIDATSTRVYRRTSRRDATSRRTPSAFANRRSKECAYKLIGTVVSGEVAFPLRRNRLRRVGNRGDDR